MIDGTADAVNSLLVDTAGNPIVSNAAPASSAFGNIVRPIHNPTPSDDFMLAVSMGLIPGVSKVNKFGANVDSAKDVVEDVWDGGGTYVYPTSATMTHLSQTADQELMRGALIQGQGLDENWAPVIQTKALDATNTTTAVAWDTPMVRTFRMKVLANVVSASPIRCHNAAENQDYAVISTGQNQTLMALFTTPVNTTSFMTNYYSDFTIGLGKEPKGVDFHLWMADRANGWEFQIKHERGIQKGAAGPQHFFKPYLDITEKTDIRMSALPYDNPCETHAGFDLIVVDNSIWSI